MDSVRHGKISAKRQYLQGSAEALRGEARRVHVTQLRKACYTELESWRNSR